MVMFFKSEYSCEISGLIENHQQNRKQVTDDQGTSDIFKTHTLITIQIFTDIKQFLLNFFPILTEISF